MLEFFAGGRYLPALSGQPVRLFRGDADSKDRHSGIADGRNTGECFHFEGGPNYGQN